MKNYLSKWNFMRVLRLVMGLIIIVYAIRAGLWSLAALGGLFSLMPLLNIGCCGASGCSTSFSKNYEKEKDITYEEVR